MMEVAEKRCSRKGYFNHLHHPVTEMSDTCSRRGTCLAQHVRGDGDGGPDGGVDSKEDHPEHHAPPYRQVGKLERKRETERRRRAKGWRLRDRKERQHEVE